MSGLCVGAGLTHGLGGVIVPRLPLRAGPVRSGVCIPWVAVPTNGCEGGVNPSWGGNTPVGKRVAAANGGHAPCLQIGGGGDVSKHGIKTVSHIRKWEDRLKSKVQIQIQNKTKKIIKK